MYGAHPEAAAKLTETDSSQPHPKSEYELPIPLFISHREDGSMSDHRTVFSLFRVFHMKHCILGFTFGKICGILA